MVKPKVRKHNNFRRVKRRRSGWFFPLIAVVIFAASWYGLPSGAVEKWYARRIFPLISGTAEKIADAIAISWLDVVLPVLVLTLFWMLRRGHWGLTVKFIAVLYLLFFASWGLNYHRQPLTEKLPADSSRSTPEALRDFTRRTAGELNRLYGEKQKVAYSDTRVQEEARIRVRRVVQVIDGTAWDAPHRIKISRVADPWFHAAGIDGMFNPAGQEPIISSTLLDVEQPFVICHELAHVRGYPDEGDANVIAALSTIVSSDPWFQYSGWFSLWLYLRDRDADNLLDAGPHADLERVFKRTRAEQIRWISQMQTAMLDIFLKANHVEQGVRSYSRIVLVTANTEPYWDRFR